MDGDGLSDAGSAAADTVSEQVIASDVVGASSSGLDELARLPATPAPDLGPPIHEDARGVVFLRGRAAPLGRVAIWGTKVSAQCRIHRGRCSRAYSFRTMSDGNVLWQWLEAGLHVDTAAEHMALPKPMRVMD